MEAWKARVYASYTDTTVGQGAPYGHDGTYRVRDHRQYVQRYRRFFPSDKQAPVLDIGCGTGGFLKALTLMGYSCVEGVEAPMCQGCSIATCQAAEVRAPRERWSAIRAL